MNFLIKYKTMRLTKIYLIIVSFLLFFSCVEDIPTQKDGSFKYSAVLIDTSNIFAYNPSLGYSPFKNRKVTLESSSYFENIGNPKKYHTYCDDGGRVAFDNLAFSDYILYSEFVDTVKLNQVTGNWDSVKVGGIGIPQITNTINYKDTIYINSVFPNLVINEIFYAGSDRSTFYFYDQFIELYNASTQTVYLDGMVLCRARQTLNPDIEIIDYVQVLYVFQFPGTPLTGTDYPLEPGEYITVAGDAVDHSQYVSSALDLSLAEWEFYNPYAGEVDNPAQNVTNILPERTIDFLINLSHNAIVLADGSEWEYGEFYSSGTNQYIHIPISTVIDAVEYSSSSESTKQLTRRLDAGFAGVGMSKYSGKSVERRIPGFDTNNSRLDFVILETPTPGY